MIQPGELWIPRDLEGRAVIRMSPRAGRSWAWMEYMLHQQFHQVKGSVPLKSGKAIPCRTPCPFCELEKRKIRLAKPTRPVRPRFASFCQQTIEELSP